MLSAHYNRRNYLISPKYCFCFKYIASDLNMSSCNVMRSTELKQERTNSLLFLLRYDIDAQSWRRNIKLNKEKIRNFFF